MKWRKKPMERLENESFIGFAKRATNALQDGLLTVEEWGEAILGQNVYGVENTRRCAKFMVEFFNKYDSEDSEEDIDKLKELEYLKEEIIKERKKLQTENSALQKSYREQARSDMFHEKVAESISKLKPFPIKRLCHTIKDCEKTGLLCISDIHAGSNYVIKGLYGEIVNKYDMETMKDRLWKLIGLVESDGVYYDDLVVAICGDVFENILRTSSLMKLQDPVIDTVIETSEFLATWINELYNRISVPIKIVTVGGNHDTVSFLGVKPRPEEENLTKLVTKFLELRFENHPHIKIQPYTDVAIETIQDVNVMFEHGVDNNLQDTIEYFSNLYNVDIDEIIAGHFHRPESKAVGLTEFGDRMIYRVGSICGCDTYSKKLRKSARPSAYFALYEKDQGHTWSRNYYL